MSDEPTLYRKSPTGWVPETDAAAEFWRASKPGEIVELTGKRPRNPKFHKLWWAVLRKISDNLEPRIPPRALNNMAKIATGHVEPYPLPNGKVWSEPKSTSFASMNEDQFRAFVRESATALCERLLPGVVPDELIAEVEGLAA